MNFLEKLSLVLGISNGMTWWIVSMYIYSIIWIIILFWFLTSIGLFLINKKQWNKIASILSWVPIVKLYSYSKASWGSIFKYIINPIVLLIFLIFIGKGFIWANTQQIIINLQMLGSNPLLSSS